MSRNVLCECPGDWQTRRVGDLCSARRGISYTEDDLCVQSEGVPFFSLKSFLRTGGFNWEGIKYYSGAIDHSRLLTSNTLLAANTDVTPDGAIIGACTCIPASFAEKTCVHSMDVTALSVDSSVDRQFLCFALCLPQYRYHMRTISAGTTVKHLDTAAFMQVPVSFPPLPEQRKIAEILGSVDENIENTHALIAKLQDLKKATMQELLTKGIGHTKFKDSPVGRIPEEWEVRTLQDVTTKIVDGVHSTPKYTETGIPFLTVENLTATSGISLNKVRYVSGEDHRVFIKRADPRVGDVLVSKDGTLGVARVVPHGFPEFSIFVSVAMLRPDEKQVLPELVRAFFDTGEYARQLAYLSAGTGLKHIHLEHFRAFQLAVPPKHQQEELFGFLNAVDRQIDTKIASLAKLHNLKKALMQDLLTGRVRVKA